MKNILTVRSLKTKTKKTKQNKKKTKKNDKKWVIDNDDDHELLL